MHDVIVIGAGPAGALAATFLGRAKLDTLVVDADQGVTRRAWVANLLGFPEGISGPDLVERGLQQVEKAGAKLVKGKAATLEKSGDTFTVTLEDGTRHEGKQVLLATGFAFDVAEQAGVATLPGTEPHVKRILEVDREGRTNLAGVWGAGTIAGVSVHVAVTAADGARVAINLVSALKGERWVDHDAMPPKS